MAPKDKLNNDFSDETSFAEHSSSEPSFSDMLDGVKPIEQDKIHFAKTSSKTNNTSILATHRSKDNNDNEFEKNLFQFSDQYEPHIDFESTLSYVQDGAPSYYAKLLRRGDVAPELILDLHGYNKETAKKDIAGLIENCKQQHLPCACIVHGVSGGILKRKVPHYLMQHPNVLAFHQAPLEWGGQGAVLLIIDIGEELEHLLPR